MSALLAGEFMLRENSKSGVSQEFKGAYLKWQKVSKEAKSLALSMLARNYQKRPTLEVCLQHPWLAVAPSRPALTLSLRTTLRSMSCITPASPLKKELLRLILNLVVSNEDLKVAIEAFRELDTDLDGAVSETELQTQLARLFPEKQAQTALTAISNTAAFSADHKLDYSEFLLCACHEILSSNANIESLFRLLDKSKDKRVTAGEVRAMLCLEQSDSADCNAWTVLTQEIGKAREEPVTCADLRAFIQTGQEGAIGKRQR
jgi:Ca2+-binding EF-hand superfamily protein